MKRLVPEQGRELNGSPFAGVVGDEPYYSIDLGAPVTLNGYCWFHAWKGSSNVSSTVIDNYTGTYNGMTATGNILTLPLIHVELAAEYRYVFKVMVNTQYIIYYFRRKVERESGNK